MANSPANTQMPQIGWIDALRRYNLGGSSWCIPRKGTADYEKVMVIRRGDEETKPRRRTVKAVLPKEEPEPEAGGKRMSRVYFYKDKFDYTLWELDGDTFTQLADWNSTNSPKGKAGFVPTMARKRTTDDGGLTYLTPELGTRKAVRPLRELYSVPARLQSQVVAGLKELGYAEDIVFDEVAKDEDTAAEAEMMEAQKPKPKKEKRVDTPEVIALLKRKADLEAERDEMRIRRDAGEIPMDKAYFRALEKFMRDLNEIDADVRKLRRLQTKAAKP